MEAYIPDDAQIAVVCQSASKSSIPSILEKAKSLAAQKSHEKDEVWTVLDQDSDSHFAHQFEKLKDWEKLSPKHHIAVSIPRFEYWLLCHFESSPSKSNAMHDVYVAKYLPGYDRKKDLERHKGKITVQSIQHAIRVASRIPLNSYHSSTPGSDVWKLVQSLLAGE